MTGVIVSGNIHVPVTVRNLESFRRWTRSDNFPDYGEVSFLGGAVWVDPTMERDDHNQIKTAIAALLFMLVREHRLGRFYGDKMRLVHPEAGLSTEPDGTFVSTEGVHRQRVQLRQGDDSIEMLGSPDMVLEVVSPTSVEKDTVHLLNLYHRAGIREYWLVNPLGRTLDFRIYRRTPKQFTLIRPRAGRVHSPIFDRSFRLMQSTGALNLSEFTLEVH